MILMEDLSDHDLVALIAQDNAEAFAEIYQRYKGVLYLHACRMLGNEDDAKDILQELFTVLWTKRKEIVLTASLSSYLYMSVRNKILDVFAHKKVEDKYLNSLHNFLSNGECITDQQVREKELIAIIEKEIGLMPPKMRRIFELSRQENLSYKEIAQSLNISDKTVKKQVNNALHILRQRLTFIFLFLLFN